MVTEIKDKGEWNIFAIIGFILSFLGPLCFIGLGLCIYSITQINKKNQKGEGLAIAGIILSSLQIFIFMIIL